MKKLLKRILEELVYIRKCRVCELEAKGITPPPGNPPGDEPDN